MSSFLYFICIRHKWLIYVILLGYVSSTYIIALIFEDLVQWSVGTIFVIFNPSVILSIWFDELRTFSFINYEIYGNNDVEIFVTLLVTNLMFWMPITFAIQMHVIKKYKKHKSIRMVVIGITVIGLTYILYIWHPCLIELRGYVPYFCRFWHT